jgi:hypothetical protein
MLIAFTYQIFIGDFLIAHFTVPELINNLLSVVRTSGRMLWPVTYLLTGLLIVLISRKLRKLIATGLMLLVLCVQVFESAEATAVTGSLFSRPGPEEQLRSPIWDELAKKYENIVVVLPNEGPILYPTNPDFAALEGSFLWREIGLFAVQNQMSLNSFYFSREPVIKNESDGRDIRRMVMDQNYDAQSLYVFIDTELWETAKTGDQNRFEILIVDSVPLLLPK